MLEDLEGGLLEYETVGKLLADIKKEFGREDEKSVKVAELQRLEQRNKMMEEFAQEFKRAARENRYEGCPLLEEFKQGMNGTIRRKLMEAKYQPGTMEQWYYRAISLDQSWKESRREEERLRG